MRKWADGEEPKYVQDPDNPTIFHLDGHWWNAGEPPRRRHACWAQTKGTIDGRHVERCPCGAIRIDWFGQWFDKNQTLKDQRKKRKRWWQRG